MPDMMDCIHTLSDEIGPRPVSSEEEQRSAEAIAGWFSEKGLEPRIEEFGCPTWTTWPYLVAFLVMVLAAGLSYVAGVVRVVALVLALAALGLFVYQRFLGGRLGESVRKGVSQNVIARYVPRSVEADPHARKVVVVAHYDTARGSLEASPSLVNGNTILQRIVIVCMVAVPVLIGLQLLPFEKLSRWFWLAACFVAILVLVAAVVLLLDHLATPYPDGANDNASGVAVMMAVADDVLGVAGAPAVTDFADEPARPRRRDERRAREAGVLPDETEIVYGRPQVETVVPVGREGGAPARSRDFDDAPERPVSEPRPQRDRFDDDLRERVRGGGMDDRRGFQGRGMDVDSTIGAEGLGEVHAREPRIDERGPRPEGAGMRGERRELELDTRSERIDSMRRQAQQERLTASVPQDDGRESGSERVGVPERDTPRSRLRTAATGDAKPRGGRPEESDQERRERIANQAPSDKPEWWTRVESKRRRDVLDTGHAESVMKARSKFADIPTTSYRRPEPEPEPEPLPIETPEETVRPAEQVDDIAAREVRPTAPDDGVFVPRTSAAPAAESAPAASQETVAWRPTEVEPVAPRDERSASLDALFGDSPASAYRDAAPVSAPASQPQPQPQPAPAAQPPVRDRRLINLPSVDGRESGAFRPVDSSVPALIDDDAFGAPQAAPLAGGYGDTPQNPGYSGQFAPLDASGPATPINPSGEFSPFAAGTFTAGETGAFIPVGSTQEFTPVMGGGDDLFIDDADDSRVDIMPTVGDFNAPASIDIPESRGRRLMDNMNDFFHRGKKHEQQQSASAWLGVDDDYNATRAGRDIGSWDNFDEDDQWKGGASVYPGMEAEEYDEVREEVGTRARRDLLGKEVWFVALGASSADHAGMKDLLAEHDRDLRGAIIINLECVGAGEICYLEREGLGKGYQSDYRMQTLIRKLSRETEGTVEIETLDWTTTDATPAMAAGQRAITLMGFDRKAPVAWRQKTDRSDIIEPSRLALTRELVTKMVLNG